jgi:hypothetical protein
MSRIGTNYANKKKSIGLLVYWSMGLWVNRSMSFEYRRIGLLIYKLFFTFVQFVSISVIRDKCYLSISKGNDDEWFTLP